MAGTAWLVKISEEENVAKEQVLIVKKDDLPKEWVRPLCSVRVDWEELTSYMERLQVTFKPRYQAETQTEYKQIIPYIIIESKKTKELAMYQRNGTESRLTGQWSIGIGGHINESDRAPGFVETVYAGLQRELMEELNRETPLDTTQFLFKGIINEEKTDVGLVHIGLVFLAGVEEVRDPDKELHNFRFADVRRIKEQKENLELWSRLSLELIV